MYIGAIPTPAATESRQEFTATANQTVFNTTGGTVGYCDCYLNGVKMANSDFSFDGADVTLTTGAAAGDVLAVVMRQADNALVALPITDSAGNNVLSESGGVVTLTADDVQSNDFSNSSGITVISLPATGTTSASIGANNASSTRQDVVINAFDGGSALPFFFQKVDASSINAFYCLADDTADLGRSSYRFDDIYATNDTIQTSDANEKENITTSDLSLDFIRRLNPVSYRFIGKTRTHYGLIAQEIETLLSTIGKETTDFAGFIKSPITDDDGNETGEYKYGLRYNEFISPMIKAIQEQQTLIEFQQSQIDALTARIEALEATA